MYEYFFARTRTARRAALVSIFAFALVLSQGAPGNRPAYAQVTDSPSVVRKISGLSEKMELITNTSRILALDKNIPRVQVNNPELLAVTPLSANQVQISAKKAGVTQVNLWDEDGQIHTVDVLIYGDLRELELALQTQFPNSTIKVYRYSNSLVLKGFVEKPEDVSPIIRLAENYAPKDELINNISVGGAPQVLLKVKVYEVSRTKLRQLGVDWAFVSRNGSFAINSVNDILDLDGGTVLHNPALETFSFGIIDNGNRFFGTLEALQESQIAKVLAEPNIVAVSGRPAKFVSGGEFAYQVLQGGGAGASTAFTVQFKEFGTIVDFVPVVLGDGNIRLEVRPEVSSIDFALGVPSGIAGSNIPGLRKRSVDTAVEMKAGQTFAIAGLVEERVDTVNHGLPYLSDLPVIGVPFRRTEDTINEIELLILVTPEFVEGMDSCEAPCGGPGWATTTPDNHDLYCTGHVEVPARCNPIRGPLSCGECGGPCGYVGAGGACNCGPGGGYNNGVIMNGINMPGGVGYEGGSSGPAMITDRPPNGSDPTPTPAMPNDLPLPAGSEAPPASVSPNGAGIVSPGDSFTSLPGGLPEYTSPRPYSPSRQPVFVRNAANPNNRPQSMSGATSNIGENGLIGPVGYDER